MRRRRALLLGAILAGLAFPAPARLRAEVPTAEELISRVPTLSSEDEACKQIELQGYMHLEDSEGFEFRVIYRAPDYFAYQISDRRDRTPLVIAADRKFLVYDPIRPAVLYGADCDALFSLYGNNDAIRFEFGFERRREGSRPSKVLLDLKPLLSGPSIQESKVVETGDGTYRLIQTTMKGNKQVVAIDLASSSIVTRFELLDGETAECLLSIGPISCNEEHTGIEGIIVPERDVLAEHLPVHDLFVGGKLDQLVSLGQMLRTLYIRMGTILPEFRDNEGLAGLVSIDWDKVRENDKHFSEVLRSLTTPAPGQPQTLSGPPAETSTTDAINP